jgi:D-beta-D-heptose 7-phosphate kinase/D-beta-D-heptose 1-phosphate adenosyltransferase
MAPRSKKPAAPHPDVMTIAELAAYLRCNKSTIYRLIKREKLPAFRIGSDWRFKRELIEKWTEEQRSKFSLPEARQASSPELKAAGFTPGRPAALVAERHRNRRVGQSAKYGSRRKYSNQGAGLALEVLEIGPERRASMASNPGTQLPAATQRLLVVGEVVLDRYLWGTVERVSPEAPIPVLHLSHIDERLGNAAFVAASVRALGAEARLLSVIGADAHGQALARLAAESGLRCDGLLEVPGRPTIVKERMLGAAQSAQRGVQQMLRVDREEVTPLDRETEAALLSRLGPEIEAADGVLVCDLDKGVLTARLLAETIRVARHQQKPVIIDPRRTDDFSIYRGATALTPNRFEAQRATGLSCAAAQDWPVVAKKLVERFDLSAALITLDRDGMFLSERGGAATHIGTTPREVYDVTGAGDVVLAIFGCLWTAGMSPVDAASVANAAASLEVTRQGATVIQRDELAIALRGQRGASRKMRSLQELGSELDRHRQLGSSICFIEVDFDLDAQHLQLLEFARAQGDVLIAGQAGADYTAPIPRVGGSAYSTSDQVHLLAALEAVDYVVAHDGLEAIEIVRAIRPDVFIAEEQRAISDIAGCVRGYGGRTVLCSMNDKNAYTEIENGYSKRAVFKRDGKLAPPLKCGIRTSEID